MRKMRRTHLKKLLQVFELLSSAWEEKEKRTEEKGTIYNSAERELLGLKAAKDRFGHQAFPLFLMTRR